MPSTYDRKAVNFEEENLFNPARVKERIKLPEEQTAYLRYRNRKKLVTRSTKLVLTKLPLYGTFIR